MKITVKWINRNEAAEGHRIYKSESPIAVDALPAEPIVTLPAESTSWVDEDVVRDKRYYYRIETFNKEDVAISTEISAEAVPYNGPGPTELLYGDYESGIFGVMESFDFVSGPELKHFTGHPLNEGAFGQRWVKVAHKGKILYVPVGDSFGRHTWLDLYKAGMVYGEDSNGPEEAVALNGDEGVNQLVTFNKFGSTFKVRLLKGLPDNYEGVYEGGALERPEDLSDSEYNQVMTRIAYLSYHDSIGTNVDQLSPSYLTSSAYSASAQACQDLIGDNAVHRSLRWGNESVTGAVCTMPVTSPHTTAGFPSTTYSNWRPVIELIENN